MVHRQGGRASSPNTTQTPHGRNQLPVHRLTVLGNGKSGTIVFVIEARVTEMILRTPKKNRRSTKTDSVCSMFVQVPAPLDCPHLPSFLPPHPFGEQKPAWWRGLIPWRRQPPSACYQINTGDLIYMRAKFCSLLQRQPGRPPWLLFA